MCVVLISITKTVFIRIPSQDSEASKQSVLENTDITMAHCVEWHRVRNSKTQKQCDTSQYSIIQHETRSDKAEENSIDKNKVEK